MIAVLDISYQAAYPEVKKNLTIRDYNPYLHISNPLSKVNASKLVILCAIKL